MADKKVDAATGEVKVEEQSKLTHVIHCKPVYNYQSVEFDWEINLCDPAADLERMENIYLGMLQMLVRMSEQVPQREAGKPSSAPVEELASEKQKEILRNFHIDFKEPLTKKQAHALIKKSMDQEIF